LKKLADSIGVQGHGTGDLVHDPRIQSAILKEMQAVGRKAGLASMEIISEVILADEEWTPQNVRIAFICLIILLTEPQKMTTATSKLNRRGLHERYKRDIEMAYKSSRN
jgi:long-chain acyl-CoA synthetase